VVISIAVASPIIGAALALVPLTRSATIGADVQGGRTTTMTAERRRLRSTIVGVELAISLALVIGAGLAVQSALHLNRQALGFAPDLLKTEAMLSIRTYPAPSDRAAVVERLVTSAATLPGIESATAVWPFPFRNAGTSRWEANSAIGMTIDATEYAIGDRYFETLRVPLKLGRIFTPMDTLTAPRVAIVSEAFARRAWPDRPAVGERIRRPATPQQPAADWITVVGVTAETRQTLTEADPPELYLPYSQRPVAAAALLVRTAGNALTVLPSLRAAVKTVDPELALFEAASLAELVAASTATQRFLAWLLGVLASFASLVAVVGVYGVIAFSLARRQPDIAMRLCLGARRDDIVRMLLRQEGTMVAAGLIGGVGLAYALTRSLASELHGIQPSDVTTFVGAGIGMALVAALAIMIPAFRTARLDIMTVFRRE
jgi:putative ABC transport system permease protein